MTTQQPKPAVFEFTKRKKWADIVLSDLPETLLLILSTEFKVLYCSAVIKELLGWEIMDLVDADFCDYINDFDRTTFREAFQESTSKKSELFIYSRLRCRSSQVAASSQKELLFEIVGNPFFIPEEDECQFMYAVAKPYPSKNMRMLHTFLELKIENVKMQHRLAELKEQAAAMSISTAPPGTVPLMEQDTSFLPSSSRATNAASRNPGGHAYSFLAPVGTGTESGLEETELDESGKRKKAKGMAGVTQYVCVTCGRIDSPEWRRGPNGPKTLCNACGLRWAKNAKGPKKDDGASGSSRRKYKSVESSAETNTPDMNDPSESSSNTQVSSLTPQGTAPW